FVGSLSTQSSVGAVAVVIVLPFTKLLVEEVNVVADAVFVEKTVELAVVHPMRPFDLAVEVGRTRTDVNVPDVLRLQMKVETGLKFRAIVGLNDEDAERQPANDLVSEANGRGLRARVVDLEYPNSGAIIDGRELVEPLPAPGDALEELHVHLQPVA